MVGLVGQGTVYGVKITWCPMGRCGQKRQEESGRERTWTGKGWADGPADTAEQRGSSGEQAADRREMGTAERERCVKPCVQLTRVLSLQ